MRIKILLTLSIIIAFWMLLYILQDAKMFTLFNVQGVPLSLIVVFFCSSFMPITFDKMKERREKENTK